MVRSILDVLVYDEVGVLQLPSVVSLENCELCERLEVVESQALMEGTWIEEENVVDVLLFNVSEFKSMDNWEMDGVDIVYILFLL
jgi:hypothetical protein